MKEKYFKKFLTVLLILSVVLVPLQEKPIDNSVDSARPFDIQNDLKRD